MVVAVLAPIILWQLWRRNVIRPRSFGQGRNLSAISAIKLTVAAMATFIAQVVGMSVAAMFFLNRNVNVQDEMTIGQQAALTMGGGIAALVCAVVAISFVRRREDSTRRCTNCTYDLSGLPEVATCPECGTINQPAALHPVQAAWSILPRAKDFARGSLSMFVAAPIVLAAGALAALAYYLIMGHQPGALAHDTLRAILDDRHNPAVPILIGAAVLVGPIVEELLFRVFIQSALLKATGRTWPAILITSILFTAAHIGGGVRPEDAQALFPLFILSLCLGVAYERTNRMWVPITMHMLFNAANVAVALVM